jgi:two-component system invasion response regulator UvrY
MQTVSIESHLHVLLVDDHKIVREGIKHMLSPYAAQWVIAEASAGFQALDHLREHPCHLAIVDLSMPGMNGLDLIHRIHTLYPSVLMLVMSMHGEEQYALRAFKAGAKGYLNKDSAAAELVMAVSKVLSGGTYVSAHLAERVVQQLSAEGQAPSHAALSDRELDVLRRIVAGQRPVDIAKALHLSIKTVSTHKSRIQDKLQLPNMAALIRYGLAHQIDLGDLAFTPEKR